MFLFFTVFLFLITGCEEKQEKLEANLSEEIQLDTVDAKMVCHWDVDYSESDKYVIGAKMVVYANNDNIVTRLVTRQVASSNEKSILENVEEQLSESADLASQYGGYSFSTKIEGNRLTVDTDIDYTKVDLETLSKDNEEMKEYLTKDYQFTLDNIRAMYVSLGVTCEMQ